MSTNLNSQIEQGASEPLRARDKAVEVQNRSLGELIEADKHLRKTSRRSPLAGLYRFIQKPGRPGGLR